MPTLGRSLGHALHTVGDYEAAALELDFVKHVQVRGNATHPRVPPGTVEIRARRRFRRRLTDRQIALLRAAIAERHPVGVELKVRS